MKQKRLPANKTKQRKKEYHQNNKTKILPANKTKQNKKITSKNKTKITKQNQRV